VPEGTYTANSVTIKGFAFSPSTITVTAGSTVTWTNTDSMPHTVTELNGLFDSGNIATSATYTHTFAIAGTFTYHSLNHSMMANATVVVTN
jgi:plastocyanin